MKCIWHPRALFTWDTIDYTELSKVHVVLQSVPLQITTETYVTLLRSDFLPNTTD